jgi:sterol desaturase/sphingolipid hydroxylase (fatty acid hydroxylase superfamily)
MRQTAFLYYLDSCFAPVVLLLLTLYAFSTGSSGWLVAVAPGWLAWSFVEYAIHRFVYHRLPMFEPLHDAHHREPKVLIGTPPGLGTVLILLVIMLPLSVLGLAAALGGTIGVLGGYAVYQTAHHAVHFWKARHGTFLYALRLHHMRHHARKDCNFGVSTSLWDHVFGTAMVLRPRMAAEDTGK